MKKASKLAKILGAVAVTAIIFTDCSCKSVKIYEKSPVGYEKTYPISYPDHMKGTFIDPFPPARRGYDKPELIKPVDKIR